MRSSKEYAKIGWFLISIAKYDVFENIGLFWFEKASRAQTFQILKMHFEKASSFWDTLKNKADPRVKL